MTRVCHVISELDVGGAQSSLVHLATAQRTAGDDVQIIYGVPGRAAEALQERGMPLWRADSLRENTISSVLRTSALLVDRWSQEPVDIVHGHSSAGGLAARIAARRIGVPAVYTAHGWPFQRGAPATQRIQSWVGEFLGARLGQAVICISDHERALARRYLGCFRNVYVVPNGLPPQPYPVARSAGPLLTMVARFDVPKRQDLLVAALASVRDLEWTCRFVGTGPQVQSVRSLAHRLGIGERVSFVSSGDGWRHAAEATVAVLLSDYEGAPMSLLEAMRAGTPILCSDLPSVRETVGHESGRLVANHVDEVAAALRLMLAASGHPGPAADRLARWGKNASDRFETRYSIGRVQALTESVYASVAAQ